MKRSLRYGVVLLLWAFFSALWGQGFVEEAGWVEEALTAETLESLEAWRLNPIDPNRDDRARLTAFPLIDPTLAERILAERQKGPFASWGHFVARLNLDPEAWGEAADCFTGWIQAPSPPLRTDLRLRVRAASPLSEGFRRGVYRGSHVAGVGRALMRREQGMALGLLVEKDPGEPDWTDFRTAFLQIRAPFGGHVLVGHYRLDIAQGLVFGGIAPRTIGIEPTAPFRVAGQSLKGNLSSEETRSLLGTACEWKGDRVAIRLFFSHAARDARIKADRIVSLPLSGLHRTASEQDAKGRVAEILGGVGMDLACRWGRLGLSGYQAAYRHPQTGPILRRFGAGGFSWDLALGPVRTTGEAAITASGGKAFLVNGFGGAGMTWAFSLRGFSRAFDHPHANAYSAKAQENEQGLWMAFRTPPRRLRLAVACDLFRRPHPTPSLPFASEGSLWLLALEGHLGRPHTFLIRYRRKEEVAMIKGPGPGKATISFQAMPLREEFRCELTSRLSHRITCRSRLEWVRYEMPPYGGKGGIPFRKEHGFLTSKGFQYFPHPSWTVTARVLFFHTDSYATRIYALEPDVPGAFSLTSRYGRGNRTLFMIAFHPRPTARFTFKYAETYHDRVASWGSGMDRIAGDVIREWTVQCDLVWGRAPHRR